jgi:DNA polymerase III subunit gamma/tau
MAYIPLHHKYRPQTFADLVGQEAITITLTNALRLEKIAPAYLFTGPRGTGKTSSARILAKSLNCMASQAPTAQPCGKCDVCNSIALGAALDIIEIDAASNTGVDNIRELIERAQYAPVQCRYKVYIIDECHMLTTAAFNSLLKTLEEPPARVVFVLATTDPQRVLPTIISRCQRFDYRRIPVAAMVKHLTYIAEIESIEIAPAAVLLIAQLAQGGLRDAESLLDRLSLLDGEITPDRVSDAIGSVPERDLLEILRSINQSDPESLLDRTRNILERGKEPLTVLQNLAGCYRDLAIAKTAPKRSDLVALTGETWTELCQVAQSWQLQRILAGQKHLKDSEIQLKHTTQPQLWLEIAVLGLLAASQTVVAQAIAPLPIAPMPPSGAGGPKNLSVETPGMPAAAAPAQPQADPVTSPPAAIVAPVQIPPSQVAPVQSEIVDIDSTWERVLQQLLPASRDLFKPFGKLILIAETQAIVAMKSSTMQTIASGKVPELSKVFSQILGRSIAVKLEVMGKSQPSNLAPSPPAMVQPSVIEPPISAPVIPTSTIEPSSSIPLVTPSPITPIVVNSSDPLPAPKASSGSGEYLVDQKINQNLGDFVSPTINTPPSPNHQLGHDLIDPPPAISVHSLPIASSDLSELSLPSDFAEPPDSVDIDRAANTPAEIAEPDLDPLLAAATDHLVKIFSGEVIDRTHALFNQIVSNHPSA